MVKSKSKYSCASAIYFKLIANIIKENYIFVFYLNKSDIKPLVLDDGHEIILANWPSYNHMVCAVNNDVPVNISSYPYVLLNRSVLGNCVIEAENNFLLELLVVCHDSTSELLMYFTVNMVFVTYFDT